MKIVETSSSAAAALTGAPPRRSRLWLWFVAAFALQIAAWVAWFTIAANHRVAEVPLATQSPQP